MTTSFPAFDQLSKSERLQLVQDLWDTIAAEPESVPVTEAQKEELGRRLAAYRKDKDSGTPWTDVKERLQAEL